jgi:chromosome segregation ATPase
MNDNDQNNEDGSVWTSYSDMFTTMAIIFLVMFVFALLRSGVSTLTAIKEKKEKKEFIDGKISKKEKIKSENLNKKLQKEIDEMQNYSKLVDDKLKQINTFAKKMRSHKDLMAETLKRQQVTQVALENTQTRLDQSSKKSKRQNKELKNLRKHVERYQKNVSKLTMNRDLLLKQKNKLIKEINEQNKINNSLNNANRELSSTLASVNSDYKIENKKVKSLSQQLTQSQNLNKQKRNQIENFQIDNKLKNQEIEKLKNEIVAKSKSLKTIRDNVEDQNKLRIMQQSELSKLTKNIENKNKEIKFINSKIEQVHKYSAGLEKTISKRHKRIQGLNKKIRDLNQQLAQEQQQKSNQQKAYNKLDKNFQNLKSYTSSLAKKVGNLEDQNGALKKELESSYRSLTQAKKQNTRISRGIASVRNNVRSRIGENIANKLNASNLMAKVDPVSGSVTLQMDDAFLFRKNDYRLSKKAKKTLKKLIPLYVDAIFSDKQASKYIEDVNIIGHASPSYGKRFSSPNSIHNQTAYNYNMELSTNRAKEIVKFIFSKEFGHFENKATFRKKVSAIGRSFSEPVRRSPSSKERGCGQYDCKSSRRVEIKFTLKEDNNIWNKLESLN